MRQIYTLRVLVLALLFLFASSPAAESQKGIPGSNSGKYAQQYEQIILQGVKLRGDVFQINDLLTTDTSGDGVNDTPAYANIFTGPFNFLACNPPQGQGEPFSYALCYYSGPNDPTGLSIDNPRLPCTLSSNGKVANCKCYKLSTDVVPPQIPYYVDIHAILNLQIYNETVDACGSEGIGCASFNGIIPPVCEAINTHQLIPGADLVSVYSPMKKADYFDGSTQCDGIYAGCMTAPCIDSGETDSDGNSLVDCSCPLFDGPFEIGQGPPIGPMDCDLGPSNVWSAAHNPDDRSLPIVTGPEMSDFAGCLPDAPPDAGCPLFAVGDEAGFFPVPDGKICGKVCDAYEEGLNGAGIQLAYSCDSTLCTTVGIEQELPFPPPDATMGVRFDLIERACSGIKGLEGLALIGIVEALAGCSCCASQICGCPDTDINDLTNDKIFNLNFDQNAVGIQTQCDLNGTLCGAP